MRQQVSFFHKISDLVLYFLGIAALICAYLFLPGPGLAAAFIWSMPLILIVLKDGVGWGVVLALLVSLCCLLIQPGIAGALAAILIAGFGLALGIAVKKKFHPGRTITVIILVSALLVIVYFLAAPYCGLPTLHSFSAAITDAAKSFFTEYNDAFVDAARDRNVSLIAFQSEVISAVTLLLPSYLIVAIALSVTLNYIFALLILGYRGDDVAVMPPFSQWHMPWWTLWGILCALVLLVGGNFFDNDFPVMIARNIFFCYFPIYLVAGISLIRYFFIRVGLSPVFQALIWIAAFIAMSFTLVFLIFLGAIDAALDYRTAMKKRKKRNDKKD